MRLASLGMLIPLPLEGAGLVVAAIIVAVVWAYLRSNRAAEPPRVVDEVGRLRAEQQRAADARRIQAAEAEAAALRDRVARLERERDAA